ncbi:hypothetical protein AB395_0000123 [Sinorhizobium fredii CCBAU 45436]|nr:hypothetical protein SF83666_c01240 [Sinorhizobium fredii CCBAU 83666]AWI55809.1 hypothetical protein AB395_0000123 [Sinorhizobium fredii CCBAU 45436]AWM23409.1 hypothetical protein AOX55_0000124 [Sinorhizobium fredii CCBAU 25509]
MQRQGGRGSECRYPPLPCRASPPQGGRSARRGLLVHSSRNNANLPRELALVEGGASRESPSLWGR